MRLFTLKVDVSLVVVVFLSQYYPQNNNLLTDVLGTQSKAQLYYSTYPCHTSLLNHNILFCTSKCNLWILLNTVFLAATTTSQSGLQSRILFVLVFCVLFSVKFTKELETFWIICKYATLPLTQIWLFPKRLFKVPLNESFYLANPGFSSFQLFIY